MRALKAICAALFLLACMLVTAACVGAPWGAGEMIAEAVLMK